MFILASQSPRRTQLLKQIGIKHKAMPSPYEEDNTLNLNPIPLIRHHAKNKALALAKQLGSKLKPDDIILGGDTIVIHNNKVLGKPHTQKKAKEMLKMIQGKSVKVASAIALFKNNHLLVDNEITEVQLTPMSEQEIIDYVKTKEPLDKAGAFAIQGYGAQFVKAINGDFYTVVGLPLARLKEMLKELTS